VSESLLSIVLGLEAVLMFFVMLTAFGVKVLPPAIAFGGGIALIVALLFAGRLLRYSWGVWVGWLLQAALIALGIVLPVMYVIGIGFTGIWVYCFVKGRQIDISKRAAQEEGS
jgi:hypothetical protein